MSECKWKIDVPCSGEISPRKMFKEFDLDVCDGHFKDHNNIVALTKKYSFDVGEVDKMSPEEREEKVLILSLSNME